MNATVRFWRVMPFVLGVLLTLEEPAQAFPVAIQISGNVTSAGGNSLPDTIHVGDIFTGIYTYDSETPDSDDSAKRGKYLHSAPYGISLFLGGFEFRTDINHTDQFVVSIANDVVYNRTYDEYAVTSQKNSPLLNGSAINYITWQLSDNTHSAFSAIDLPIEAPILSQWNYNYFETSGPDLWIRGTVTQAVLIPEPATMLLLSLGGLLVRRKR